MKNNVKLIIAIIVIILAIVGAIKLFSTEDVWICEKGQWVRHGNPASAAPIRTCK